MKPIFLHRLFEYELTSRDTTGAEVLIRLNPGHPIYSGHFPGNPITPGVCTLQMVEEVCADLWGYPLRLVQLEWIKYLAFIDPRRHPELALRLRFEHRAEEWGVQGGIYTADQCFVKIKGRYRRAA